MYYGFDMGGTKIEFSAFDEKLTCLATERIPTPVNDYHKLLQSIAELVFQYDQKFGVKGYVGIGLPGIENPQSGKVFTANILCAQGQMVGRDLGEIIKRPVKIENDANCFVLSEAWDKEFREIPSVMGLILGTGFGGGLVLNGQIFSGLNHVAGEFGHMRLPLDAWFLLGDSLKAPCFSCGCGQKGCLDNYLSGRGFEALYLHRYDEKRKAVKIIEAHEAGEKNATEFIDLYLELLAICFGGLFTAFDPHLVVLGGGLSNFDLIYDEVPKRLSKYLLSLAKPPRIIKARYGDSGGVRGAAFLNIK